MAKRDDSALALAATTAAGSILVNIAQATDKATLHRDAARLRAQREELVGVLQEWQGAHAGLRNRYEKVTAELADARSAKTSLEAEVERLRADDSRLTLEALNLKARVVDLESKLADKEPGA